MEDADDGDVAGPPSVKLCSYYVVSFGEAAEFFFYFGAFGSDIRVFAKNLKLFGEFID